MRTVTPIVMRHVVVRVNVFITMPVVFVAVQFSGFLCVCPPSTHTVLWVRRRAAFGGWGSFARRHAAALSRWPALTGAGFILAVLIVVLAAVAVAVVVVKSDRAVTVPGRVFQIPARRRTATAWCRRPAFATTPGAGVRLTRSLAAAPWLRFVIVEQGGVAVVGVFHIVVERFIKVLGAHLHTWRQ